MPLNIVLIEPEIPNNTGNIGRLCLGTGSKLHLVKPFGFEISDKRLKRAGLDYWEHLEVVYYENAASFFEINRGKNMAFFSSHGQKSHWGTF
jgi:tRNA (cytidine/uridine-2'-O-)-methyltransferase